jgi:hypothetical protein
MILLLFLACMHHAPLSQHQMEITCRNVCTIMHYPIYLWQDNMCYCTGLPDQPGTKLENRGS